MEKIDYSCYFLATQRDGSQESKPDNWTVRIREDNRYFYYDAPVERKQDFEDWAKTVFDYDQIGGVSIDWR